MPSTNVIPVIDTPVLSVLVTLTLNARDMAELVLRRSEKTFRNIKPELIRLGMPAPLDLPGDALWDREEVVAWLATRRQAKANKEKKEVPQPAEQAPAVPAKRGPGRPRKPILGGVA